MSNSPKLIKDIDYQINEEGNLVFTAAYLLKRGHCCQSGCLNCPYGYHEKVDPLVPSEFRDAWGDNTHASDYSEYEYEEDDNDDD